MNPKPARPLVLRPWLALTIASAALFVASWIVLPAPTYACLVLAIAATEASVWLGLVAGIGGGVALLDIRRHRAARVAAAVALVSIALASLPLVRFPSATRRFEAEMTAVLGEDYLQHVPADAQRTMRPSPLIAMDLFRGVDPGAARVERGIAYAAPEGVPLMLDVYRPPAAGRFPTVVQLYAGAWQRGAPGDNAGCARYLAARGHVVFAIDYRHAPRWRWPAQLDDVRTGLAWIREHAAEYDADATRLALVGRSAGAQLAMIAAYRAGAPPVRAVVSYYGPVDLTEGYRDPPRPDPLDVRPIEEALLGGTPDAMPARYREASPITYATRPLPPTLLVYAGRDHVVKPRFGAAHHARLRASGTTTILLEIPWAEHAFDAIPHGPSSQLALYHTERFLAWALRGP